MKIAAYFAWRLLGLLICSLALGAEDAAKQYEPKKIDVKVRVVDRSGSPIAGAAVQAWKNKETQLWSGPSRAELLLINDRPEILTDTDGWATFSVSLAPKVNVERGWDPNGYLCFTAQAKGFLITRGGSLLFKKSNHFQLTMTLRRLQSIAGRVLDDRGHPVPGATVFHTGNAVPRVETKTDDDGRFQIEGLPEGKAPLFVTHPDNHFHGQLVDAANAELQIRLLRKEQTPPPRRTQPPLYSAEEEREIARQVIEPLWEATMKSAEESEKEWRSEWYACIAPWRAYEVVKKGLNRDCQEAFLVRAMPLLYAADAEEALAVLEASTLTEELKALALLRTLHETLDLSRQQRLELLDRAMQHAQAIETPNDRILRLSHVALQLFDEGNAEAAKRIRDEFTPHILSNLSQGDAYASVTAGEVIALFDFPAGVEIAKFRKERNEREDFRRLCSLFHIAYRRAASNPAEAEQLVNYTLEADKPSMRQMFQERYHREPTEIEISGGIDYDEERLVPTCYWMATADPDRAERLATAVHNPFLRAYALGMVAKALAPKDQSRARQDILRSFEILTEAVQHPQRYWFNWQLSASNMAGALLATVEEIDPTLVEQCLWQAVSFRMHRPADDFLIGSYPERCDACLAAFIGRYDRDLALAIFPAKDASITPRPEDDYRRRLDALALIDPRQALEELGDDLSANIDDRRSITELLTTPRLRRWNKFASRLYIWTPDYEHFQSSFPW